MFGTATPTYSNSYGEVHHYHDTFSWIVLVINVYFLELKPVASYYEDNLMTFFQQFFGMGLFICQKCLFPLVFLYDVRGVCLSSFPSIF